MLQLDGSHHAGDCNAQAVAEGAVQPAHEAEGALWRSRVWHDVQQEQSERDEHMRPLACGFARPPPCPAFGGVVKVGSIVRH